MQEELLFIKKKYGEEMMHLCRKLFPTILETKGALSKILLDNFYPNHSITKDLVGNDLIYDFKNFIQVKYQETYDKNDSTIETSKTPFELLDKAGYILYECKTNKDILKFKKYYKRDEEICTFNENRLLTHYVFFAVKKDASEIIREDFSNPKRQDLYGTSVISIQFTRDENHTLSIKNRYNHTVNNPDATFSNNLDNIIQGLTNSFSKHYGLKQTNLVYNFEMPYYILANNKYYKYNLVVDDTYYCPNNILIINKEVRKLEKEKYLFLDNSILDLKKNEFIHFQDDYLKELIGKIKKMEIKNDNTRKIVRIINDKCEETVIILNMNGEIIGLKNNYIENIPDDFLYYNMKMEILELLNVKKIPNNFLYHNKCLKCLNIPDVIEIGNNFLYNNILLKNISLAKVERVGHNFIWLNKVLESLSLPNLKVVGDNFLYSNETLDSIDLPNLVSKGFSFIFFNDKIRLSNKVLRK